MVFLRDVKSHHHHVANRTSVLIVVEEMVQDYQSFLWILAQNYSLVVVKRHHFAHGGGIERIHIHIAQPSGILIGIITRALGIVRLGIGNKDVRKTTADVVVDIIHEVPTTINFGDKFDGCFTHSQQHSLLRSCRQGDTVSRIDTSFLVESLPKCLHTISQKKDVIVKVAVVVSSKAAEGKSLTNAFDHCIGFIAAFLLAEIVIITALLQQGWKMKTGAIPHTGIGKRDLLQQKVKIDSRLWMKCCSDGKRHCSILRNLVLRLDHLCKALLDEIYAVSEGEASKTNLHKAFGGPCDDIHFEILDFHLCFRRCLAKIQFLQRHLTHGASLQLRNTTNDEVEIKASTIVEKDHHVFGKPSLAVAARTSCCSISASKMIVVRTLQQFTGFFEFGIAITTFLGFSMSSHIGISHDDLHRLRFCLGVHSMKPHQADKKGSHRIWTSIQPCLMF